MFSVRTKHVKTRHIVALVITAFCLLVPVAIGVIVFNSKNQPDDLAPSGQPIETTLELATTLYVSPGGSDKADGKTAQAALKSIQQALSRALPGDVIQLADGEYYESIKSFRSGTEREPIVLKGSKEAVVKGAGSRIIEINHDYIHLIGFTVDGKVGSGTRADDYRDKLIYVQGTGQRQGVVGLRIYKMTMLNAGGECVRLRYFARNNEISHSTIQNCGTYDFKFNDGGKNGEGIYIGTAPEQRGDGKNPTVDIDVSQGNYIHHNTIETNGNECVDIKEGATKNIVEYNHCSNQRDPESGGMDSRGSGNVFRYNTIIDTIGAGIRLGGDEVRDGIDNDVYNNTLINTGSNGIKIQRGPQGKICGNTFENVQDEINGDAANGLKAMSCNIY